MKTPFKRLLTISVIALFMIGLPFFAKAEKEARGIAAYSQTLMQLGKTHALMLEKVRLVLLEDGDLLATSRTTRNGRALYGAKGDYEGLARSGVNNWLIYDQEHQLVSTAHKERVTRKTAAEPDDESSPFALFKKPEAVTNTVSSIEAIQVLDVSGNPIGSIQQNQPSGFSYFDASGKLQGLATTRDDGTLILTPPNP